MTMRIFDGRKRKQQKFPVSADFWNWNTKDDSSFHLSAESYLRMLVSDN